MADVNVTVKIDDAAFMRAMYAPSSVAQAVNTKAQNIVSNANGMAVERSGIWHEVGKPHNPNKTGGTWIGNKNITDTIGGTPSEYGMKNAKRIGADGVPVAIVFTANYAAQKDNLKHNTLLGAIG